MPLSSLKIKLVEIAMKILAILAMSVLFLYGCVSALNKQAEADYQKCLSWQADGYPIKCDAENYR